MIRKKRGSKRYLELVKILFVSFLAFAICIQFVGCSQQSDVNNKADAGSTSGIQNVSRMALKFTIDGKDITAYYTGALVENRPFGEGIYEFDDPSGPWKYIGTMENGMFANGSMTDYPYTMTFKDNQSYSKYSGPILNSQPVGEGVYTIVSDGNTATLSGHYDPQNGFSGDVSLLSMSFEYNGTLFSGLYTGEYLNGQPNGTGTFLGEGELFFYYKGTWDNGSIIGPGELHTNNAQISFNNSLTRAEYSGHIENGCFNGEGTISLIGKDSTSYVYSGNWLNNLYSGDGTLSVSSPGSIGYTYTGSWDKGLYDGMGTLVYNSADIIKYDGNFEKGKYRPTFIQLVSSLCSAENSKVVLSDYVIQYLNKYQTDFLNNSTADINLEPGFSYETYAELQTEENSCCFTAHIRLIQIKEYDEDVFGFPVSEFLGYDSSNRMYYGYFFGYFDGIKSGDMAEINAYPIGYGSYKSQDGQAVPSLRFLAFSISRIPG